MKVLIGGGTGFVGRRLQQTLKAKGHEVVSISRTTGTGKIAWDEVASSGLPECQAVVNLAGEPLLNPWRRWSDELYEELRKSRVDTNQLLVKKITEAPNPPEVLIGTCGAGFYPPSETIVYTEDYAGSDEDVMSRLNKASDQSAKLPEGCKTRLVNVRFGGILGKEGGILQQMVWPFWLGLGGVIGSGNQPLTWIHIQDLCDLITFAIENTHVTGPLNGVAPVLSTNRDFTKALASVLHRPSFIPVPAFVINGVFGPERGRTMLEGQKVIPKRTQELGYTFQFTDLETAIADALK